jgi:hypothetical protein
VDAHEFRKRAEECRQIARIAGASNCEFWLRLAEEWTNLAALVEARAPVDTEGCAFDQ